MIAIKGGKVLTITSGTIERGTVLIEGGKIKACGGPDVAVPAGAEVYDATGKWVMPGLIDAHSHLSLFGDPSVPATADGNEMTSPNTAQLRGRDSLNPDDPAIAEVVRAGVTAVFTGPGSANVIGGTGMVIKLCGRTAEEMIIPGTEGMKMALGENPKRVYGEMQKKYPATRMGNAAVLREALVEAQDYLDKISRAEAEGKEKNEPPKLPDRSLKLEALGRVLRREIKARIHCHRADDIMTAIGVAEEFGLCYVLEHCTEGYLIADILAAKKASATIGPLLMSHAKHELWKVSMRNPGILAKAGVKVAIQADTSAGTKWLPIHVGLAMRYGMEEQHAFEAVTINPAEILGVAGRLGSLEPGKDADVAVFDGHPFCNFTHCERTYIDGKLVFDRATAPPEDEAPRLKPF
jgi:imidazolonepropionase-like amidohydrolase